MDESSGIETEQLAPEVYVRKEMVNHGFAFRELEGVEVNPPSAIEVKGKYNDEVMDYLVDVMANYVKMPLIEYPQDVDMSASSGINAPIDQADQKMRDLFEAKGQEYKDAFEKVIIDNRFRVNPMQNVQSAVSLATMSFLDSDAKAQTLNQIYQIMTSEDSRRYKSLDREDKLRVVRQNTKAAEFALRCLNDETITPEQLESVANL